MLGEQVLGQPQRYAVGEVLPTVSFWTQLASDERYSQRLQWHYRGEAVADSTRLSDRVQAGWVLGVEADLEQRIHCAPGQACPRSGIWEVEPRNMTAAIREFDGRLAQTYVEQGQPMPHPQKGWLAQTPPELQIAAGDFSWLWLGHANAIGPDQQLHITVPEKAV